MHVPQSLQSEPESSQLCQNAKAKAKHSLRLQSEPRSCVKVEVAVLGSPSLISLMVSVDVKQH